MRIDCKFVFVERNSFVRHFNTLVKRLPINLYAEFRTLHGCDRDRLTVHTGKTEVMLICSRAFVGPLRPLMFGNSHLNFTIKSTCLGIIIDYNLNCKSQVTSLYIKFGGKLKFLKTMRGLPSCVLEEIYYKRIVPNCITYCIAV